ncbi:MAG TPA: hypothetical protein ENK11_02575, partial [Phycisphaerales bacterium]|nr:hypothetical protein [Phycisphaerales bacterium]
MRKCNAACLLPLLAGTACVTAGQIHVPADFQAIQAAIDAAAAGDEIIVAPGTYSGPINLSKGVVLRSEAGPDETVLQWSGGGSVVVIESNDGATLAGFTVTGGNAQNGGGLFVSGDAVVADCIIRGNTATNGGGAFLVGSPTLSGVSFEDNNAGAGGAVCLGPDADAVIDNCTFSNNSADTGGGVYVGPGVGAGTFAVVGAGSFETNSADRGGGLFVACGGVEVDQSVFEANSAASDGGAVELLDALPSTISETRFEGNNADERGGAVRLSGISDLLISNGTVTQNTAGRAGGGIDSDPGATLSVGGSTLFGNQPADIEGQWNDLGGNSFEQGPLCDADLAAPFGILDMNDIMA